MSIKEIIVSRKNILDFINNNIYYSLIIERIKEEGYTKIEKCDNETLGLIGELFGYIEDTNNEVLIVI